MKVKAYAKINLLLKVLKKDKSGYHKIFTVMQQVNLFDEITFLKLRSPGLKLKIIGSEKNKLSISRNNTIIKAFNILQEKYPSLKKAGLKIVLKKNIPVTAGLGGGTSDAIATIKAINNLYDLKISPRKFQNLACKIGMDGPFFLKGGLAAGTHFGEKISQFKGSPNLLKKIKSSLKHTLLFLPKNSRKISTANAYELLSAVPKSKTSPKSQVNEQLFENDFDLLYQKQIASFKKELSKFNILLMQVSGAGPAMFVAFKSKKNMKQAQQKLKSKGKVWAI